MNTDRELQKVIEFLDRDHPDAEAACKIAALQLTIVLRRRQWRRERDQILSAAVEAAEAEGGGG